MRFFCLFLFSLTVAYAQSIEAFPEQLNFADTFEDEREELSLRLRNSSTDTLDIASVEFRPLVGAESDFSATYPPSPLLPGDSVVVRIFFEPRHNIAYNTEMVVSFGPGREVIAIDLRGNGRFRNTYYNTTFDLDEEDLKRAFKTRLAQGYRQLSYNAARDRMYMEIDNQRVNGGGATVNTLEGVYTGVLATNYSNRQQAQGQSFNTEHTFPQGFFNQRLPERSDLHHLFPTNITANSRRGNLPFGVGSGSPDWQQGGSKQWANDVFEPRDKQKGDAARAMFYFVLRYENYGSHLTRQEASLRAWHAAFPVDAVDRRRNDDVERAQGNRNPLVDYPQFVERIGNFSGTSTYNPPAPWLTQPEVVLGTVLARQPQTYAWVLVNPGRSDIQVGDFATADSALSLSTSDSFVLAAGEDTTIVLTLESEPTPDFQSSFSFSYHGTNYTVPVEAQVVSPSRVAPNFDLRFTAYTASKGFVLDFAPPLPQPTSWRLIDLRGRTVRAGTFAAGLQTATIPREGLARGLYLIKLTHNGRSGLSWLNQP